MRGKQTNRREPKRPTRWRKAALILAGLGALEVGWASAVALGRGTEPTSTALFRLVALAPFLLIALRRPRSARVACIVAVVIIALNVEGHRTSLFVDNYGDIAYALDTTFPPFIAFVVWAVVTAVESGLRRGSRTRTPPRPDLG